MAISPKQIEVGEWLYYGCFIQKQVNIILPPFVVFKNNKAQTHIGTCYTFTEAKKLCILNEVKEQYLEF
ncbi:MULTISPECIES: hypothetical protein [unclassified Pedobacter]|uniref:hypothetical protein n=1 Tax=unclassified Pedobacter TaxID=2628915 RepID=UPI00141DDE1A|nr:MULTISPECIES: hypothetical protein [unclassified Pedobacter]NII81714.1 hypothetical protein [Pedobacter sp. SG908]NMN35718.1 hypothetical protein [Pedobacter sp. SG918]